ncbi:MAG: hypothetical protein K1X52_03505 [Pyrinomonadaceae bacterium]|nr:hypothetical protein [Pyrinomonadaceae bacterium]
MSTHSDLYIYVVLRVIGELAAFSIDGGVAGSVERVTDEAIRRGIDLED